MGLETGSWEEAAPASGRAGWLPVAALVGGLVVLALAAGMYWLERRDAQTGLVLKANRLTALVAGMIESRAEAMHMLAHLVEMHWHAGRPVSEMILAGHGGFYPEPGGPADTLRDFVWMERSPQADGGHALHPVGMPAGTAMPPRQAEAYGRTAAAAMLARTVIFDADGAHQVVRIGCPANGAIVPGVLVATLHPEPIIARARALSGLDDALVRLDIPGAAGAPPQRLHYGSLPRLAGPARSSEIRIAGQLWRVEVIPAAHALAWYGGPATLLAVAAGGILALLLLLILATSRNQLRSLSLRGSAQQRTLTRNQALLATVFETSPLLLLLLDAADRPVLVNRVCRSVLGYTDDQFHALGWSGLLHPDDRARPRPVVAWAAADLRLIAADGSIIHGRTRVTRLRDHGEARTLVTIEDITGRRETEARVQFQASLLDQAANPILAIDGGGHVVYTNRAAQDLFCWESSLLQGLPLTRLLDMAVDQDLGEELETTGTTWNGSRFPAGVRIGQLRDDHGRPAGHILAVTDLTTRRMLDRQLVHSARLATLGELSASIAHELNHSLHVIQLAAEAMQLDLADGRLDPDRTRRRSEHILSQVARLVEMIGLMRAVSRPEQQQTRRRFSPRHPIDAALRIAEPLLQRDGITLQVGFPPGDLPEVMGFPVQLEQVLLNLLTNARDAIAEHPAPRRGPAGGTIRLDCRAEDGMVVISVADDGPGIPADLMDRMFEPFVTTKDGNRGCGLGLSISRSIVTDMGGSLNGTNGQRGAVFTVALPCADRPRLVPAPLPAPARDEDARRALVVDDDAHGRDRVAGMLRHRGFAVDAASDGLDAARLCAATLYDVVVTDLQMPHLDGRGLIEHLREVQPGTPVIVVTGHAAGLEKWQEPVVALLTKPFQQGDLLAAVDAAVS